MGRWPFRVRELTRWLYPHGVSVVSVPHFPYRPCARCCYQRCEQTWNGCCCIGAPQRNAMVKRTDAALQATMPRALAKHAPAPSRQVGFFTLNNKHLRIGVFLASQSTPCESTSEVNTFLGLAADCAHGRRRKYLTCCVRLSPEKEPDRFVALVKELAQRGSLTRLAVVPMLCGAATGVPPGLPAQKYTLNCRVEI